MAPGQAPLRARSHRAGIALAIGLSLALVCCELLVNTSHLDSDYGQGGREAGQPGTDARKPQDANPPRDVRGPDHHTKGPADGGMPSDAGTPKGDASHFCERQVEASFCADFDDGSVTYAVPVGWGADIVNATMSLDTDAWVSPPASLHVDLFATDGGSPKSVAKLSTQFSRTVTKFRVAFDMRVDVVDTATQSVFEPFDVSFNSTGGVNAITLTFELASNGGAGDSGAAIYYQQYVDGSQPAGSGKLFSFAHAPGAGVWTHVDIALTLNASSGTVSAALNDASVLETSSYATVGSTQDPDFELGGTVFAPTNGWGAHFDNFVIWLE